ncbi:hypothetical protein [Anianabacter salinae]|uniref:hypothetical protein n=1 Tax=Anianabacter salinae TaxID=2851023 RepID=UPI00225E4406|nr:hypothetical protein [Anianabacter salinae]MBV0912816.1 hypothetical protein [Anianabacter salinae]
MRATSAIALAACAALPQMAAASDGEVYVYSCVSDGAYSYTVNFAPDDPGFVDVDRYPTSNLDVASGTEGDLADQVGELADGSENTAHFVLMAEPSDPMSFASSSVNITFSHDLSAGVIGATANGNVASDGDGNRTTIGCELTTTDAASRPADPVMIDTAGLSFGATIFEQPDPNSAVLLVTAEDSGIQVMMDTGVEMDNFRWFFVDHAGVSGYHWGGNMCVPGAMVEGARSC